LCGVEVEIESVLPICDFLSIKINFNLIPLFSQLGLCFERRIMMFTRKTMFPLFLTVVLLFITVGISRADFEGTVGTRFIVTGSEFGINKPKVYIEYEKKPGMLQKAYAKVETWSDTSITCLWTKTLSAGTYNLWVKPNIKAANPIAEGTFTIMPPSIDEVTPDTLTPGATITINGQFFTDKKPKVYLRDLVSLRKKSCKVVRSTMDPDTGASSLNFIVPKWGSGNYEIILQTPVWEASMNSTVSLSGKVTDSSLEAGIAGVTMTLTGAHSVSIATGTDGTYSFTGIQNGQYTITPSKSGYSFSPQSIALTLDNSDITGQDFMGILHPVLIRIGVGEAVSSLVAASKKFDATHVLDKINVQSGPTAVETTADYYTGLGESISLYLEIDNPSGYSISRFKINGTAFTSGSFTTDPIQPGQTTTVIRTGAIFLGSIAQDITYTISDIKYIAEFGQASGNEKDVVINPDSVSSTTVSIGFSGSGTVDDPYLITNKGQLKAVARCTNGNIGGVDGYNGKYLKLTADLDLTGENWTPIGTEKHDGIYNYSFKGTFDGGGNSISNLTINSSLFMDIGLFGSVYGGTIKNIVLNNCQITNTIHNGRAGGIAGTMLNGLVSNCSSAGNVSVTSSDSTAAGIVGSVGSHSTIVACSNSATISSGSSSAVDNMAAGGIAGFLWESSTVQNCYNAGNVSAQGSTDNIAGGIVTEINSGNSVSNCYNVGAIAVSNTGFSYCMTGAGIVGANEGSVTNSVWLDGSAGAITCITVCLFERDTPCVGTATVTSSKSSSDMMLQSTYTGLGWDFSDVWKMSAGEYPTLKWQN
jgi:hypothetical protein